MRKIIIAVLFFLISAIAAPTFAQTGSTQYKAEIVKIENTKGGQKATVRITQGNLKDRQFETVVDTSQKTKVAGYKQGDDVIVAYSKTQDGRELVYIADKLRTPSLLLAFILFLGIVIWVGRLKGITSFLGMAFSFVIIFQMIIPQIIAGTDPVIVSLIAAFIIIPALFLLGHGFNKKTIIAAFATFLSLVLTSLLAYLFIKLTRLTGFASDDVVFVQHIKEGAINLKNLLLAGIIIGSLGVLDDITVSQASVVERLNIANKNFSFKELYKQAMEVGRDHIASLVNTLILVYTGASLPLFLLFFNTKTPYSVILNQEAVATEIVRTLVSSIGIVAAVPLTTVLACYFFKKDQKKGLF